jgi:hypothetical protein
VYVNGFVVLLFEIKAVVNPPTTQLPLVLPSPSPALPSLQPPENLRCLFKVSAKAFARSLMVFVGSFVMACSWVLRSSEER